MKQVRLILGACVLLLAGLIFYDYWSGQDLALPLKILSIVCIVLYFVFIWMKYRR